MPPHLFISSKGSIELTGNIHNIGNPGSIDLMQLSSHNFTKEIRFNKKLSVKSAI